MATHQRSAKGGRPPGIHRKYFEFSEDGKTATCIVFKVVDSDSTTDGVVLIEQSNETEVTTARCPQPVIRSADSPTNLKRHLELYHKDLWKSNLEKVPEKPAALNRLQVKTSLLCQDSLEHSWIMTRKMDRGSNEETAITRSLALYVGSTNAAYSTVENEFFRDYSQKMNARYVVPCRKTINRTFSTIVIEAKDFIKKRLSSSSYLSVIVDLWTKADQTPFIGVGVCYFDEGDNKRHHLMIALREFHHPHTGERVYDIVMSVLEEWSVPNEKVLKIVTDNGANIVKAFTKISRVGSKATSNDVPDCSDIEFETESDTDEEYPEQLTHVRDDNLSDQHLLNLIAHQYRCDGTLEKENSDEETVDRSPICEDDVVNVDNFEEGLRNICHRTHLGCTVHTLQLVVKAFEKSDSFSKILKRALKLVARVTISSKSSMRLRELSGGYTLLKHCPTRWSSLFNLLQRLIVLKDQVIQVCAVEKIDGLHASQWDKLTQICHILEPFADCTNTLQATKEVTVSMVFPCILELEMHLRKIIEDGICRKDAESTLSALQSRFEKYLDSMNTDFDPVFIVATFLDPRYKALLNDDQKQIAMAYVLRKIDNSHQQAAGTTVRRDVEGINSSESDGLCPKKFKFVQQVLREKMVVEKDKPSVLVEELSTYSNDKSNYDFGCDPISFWSEKRHAMSSRLPVFACHFLSIPPSSSFVETIFSYAGFSSAKLRNKISAKNLEREVFLKVNRAYLKHLM